MVSFFCRDDRGKGGKGEVDTREAIERSDQLDKKKKRRQHHLRYQVGLEFVQIDVKGTIEAQRGGNGRYNLSDQPVQVGEAWRSDIEVLLADVINSFVVNLAGKERKNL
jgi:hypothetical protein